MKWRANHKEVQTSPFSDINFYEYLKTIHVHERLGGIVECDQEAFDFLDSSRLNHRVKEKPIYVGGFCIVVNNQL